MRTSVYLVALVVAPGAALLAPPVRRLRAAPPSMAMVPAPGSEVVFENINLLGFIGRGLRSVRRVAALDPKVVLRELQRAVQFDDLVAILLFNALVDPALRTLWRLRRGNDGAPFEASIYAAVRPALRLLGGVLGGLYVLDVAFVCASIAELQPPWRVPQLVAGVGYTLVAGKLLTSLKDRFLEHRVLPSMYEKKKNRANVFVIKRGTGVAIWALCAAVCFEVLRFSIGLTLGSIFSFAGISGIALGFATKDLVSNWVGGALLVLTQPFVPGDEPRGNRPLVWGVPTKLQNSLSPYLESFDVHTGDKIQMTELGKSVVEQIGWYQCLVRGDDDTYQTVPNSKFLSNKVSNLSKRKHRYMRQTFHLRYEDLSKAEAVCARLRDELAAVDGVDTERRFYIFVKGLRETDVEFEVEIHFKGSSGLDLRNRRQAALLKIASVVREEGADFAVFNALLGPGGTAGPAALPYAPTER